MCPTLFEKQREAHRRAFLERADRVGFAALAPNQQRSMRRQRKTHALMRAGGRMALGAARPALTALAAPEVAVPLAGAALLGLELAGPLEARRDPVGPASPM
jgi:hypothetical protein